MSNSLDIVKTDEQRILVEDLNFQTYRSATSVNASSENVHKMEHDLKHAVSNKQTNNDLFTKGGSVSNIFSSPATDKAFDDAAKTHELIKTLFDQDGLLKGWKLTKRISSRVLKFSDTHVLLDCLVNKEEGFYKKWEFERLHFEGIELYVGKTLKLNFYNRPNQAMMEIQDNPNLVSKEDFPDFDFISELSDIDIFNKL